MAARPRESNDRREIVDIGVLQTTGEGLRLLLGEEGQNHLALITDEADEAVRLFGLVALEVGVAHDQVESALVVEIC